EQVRLNAAMVKNVVTYTVVLAVDNSDRKLLPYLTAAVRFPGPEVKDALLVPNEALRWKPNLVPPRAALEDKTRGLVYIGKYQESIERSVSLRLGRTDGEWTEVVEGDLKPGDAVIVGVERGGK